MPSPRRSPATSSFRRRRGRRCARSNRSRPWRRRSRGRGRARSCGACRRCSRTASAASSSCPATPCIPTPAAPIRRWRRALCSSSAAARALFGFPYADMNGAHAKWLVDKKAALKRQRAGAAYFNAVLDQLGIETSMANRVAMAPYLDPARFKWVFFVDCFMFPFDNSALAAKNGDEAVYMPLQTKLVQQYAQRVGVSWPPASFGDYLAFLKASLEENKRRGGVAVKFEAAYFRSLSFGDPGSELAELIYRK